MSKPRRELQILGDFLHAGAQAAGVWWNPTAASGNGELNSHECGEIVFVEIVPPVAAGPVVEVLTRVQLVLDNTLEQYNLLPGTDTYLVNAPRINMLNGIFLALGVPTWNASTGLAGALRATCPKFRKSVTISALAGGAITASYRVRLWGYRYRAADLLIPGVVPAIGGADVIVDPVTGRVSDPINRSVIVPTEDTWTQLPGGLDQATPKIFNFIRMAFNAAATTVNTPYEFRFDTANVATREEDLLFPYNVDKKIAVIKGLGVHAPANLLQTWIDIGGDERPYSRFPTTSGLNPLHFGNAGTFVGGGTFYQTIPLLSDPVTIINEKAVVRVQDNGVSIPANQIAVIVNGTMVELT